MLAELDDVLAGVEPDGDVLGLDVDPLLLKLRPAEVGQAVSGLRTSEVGWDGMGWDGMGWGLECFSLA